MPYRPYVNPNSWQDPTARFIFDRFETLHHNAAAVASAVNATGRRTIWTKVKLDRPVPPQWLVEDHLDEWLELTANRATGVEQRELLIYRTRSLAGHVPSPQEVNVLFRGPPARCGGMTVATINGPAQPNTGTAIQTAAPTPSVAVPPLIAPPATVPLTVPSASAANPGSPTSATQIVPIGDDQDEEQELAMEQDQELDLDEGGEQNDPFEGDDDLVGDDGLLGDDNLMDIEDMIDQRGDNLDDEDLAAMGLNHLDATPDPPLLPFADFVRRIPLQGGKLSKEADDVVQGGRTAGLPKIHHFRPTPEAISRSMPLALPSYIRTINNPASSSQKPSTSQAEIDVDTSNWPRDAVAAYQKVLRERDGAIQERDEVARDRNKLRSWRNLMADTQYEMAPKLLAREAQRKAAGDEWDPDEALSQKLYVEELEMVKGRVENELAKAKDGSGASAEDGSTLA